jgi:hypothetical protein
MPYLTNAEKNELKRLETTTGEGILGDEELWAAKGTRSSSVGYSVLLSAQRGLCDCE